MLLCYKLDLHLSVCLSILVQTYSSAWAVGEVSFPSVTSASETHYSADLGIIQLFFFYIYLLHIFNFLTVFVCFSLSLSSRSLARPHPNRQLRSPLWSLHSLRYQTFFFKYPFRPLLPQWLSLDKPKHLSTPHVQFLSHWPRYYLKYV